MDNLTKTKMFNYNTGVGLRESVRRLEESDWDYDKALKQWKDEQQLLTQ